MVNQPTGRCHPAETWKIWRADELEATKIGTVLTHKFSRSFRGQISCKYSNAQVDKLPHLKTSLVQKFRGPTRLCVRDSSRGSGYSFGRNNLIKNVQFEYDKQIRRLYPVISLCEEIMVQATRFDWVVKRSRSWRRRVRLLRSTVIFRICLWKCVKTCLIYPQLMKTDVAYEGQPRC